MLGSFINILYFNLFLCYQLVKIMETIHWCRIVNSQKHGDEQTILGIN